MPFQRLRGFQDVIGDEARAFAHAESVARRVFWRFGFEEMRTPLLEEEGVFKRALGEDTDVVQKEMYAFKDRGGTPVALRPEGTAGVVRAYLENNFHKTKEVAKIFYLGAMFRGERPQAGRLRQFHQIGAETLGTASPYADAETVHALAVFLEELGVSGYTVKLNNLGDPEERKDYRIALTAYYNPLKARLCEDCRRRLETNVLRLLDCKEAPCRALREKAPLLDAHLGQESRAHFEMAKKALDAAGVSYAVDAHLVRGLDYYTRTVFEVTHPGLGAQDALAAGGRYDRLVESFGGPAAGAVGFAIGVERLLSLCPPAQDSKGKGGACVFIVTLGAEAQARGFSLLSELRHRHGVAAEMDLSPKSLKSQMRSADKSGARFSIILGEDELKKGILVVKDMTTGKQEEFSFEGAAAALASRTRA